MQHDAYLSTSPPALLLLCEPRICQIEYPKLHNMLKLKDFLLKDRARIIQWHWCFEHCSMAPPQRPDIREHPGLYTHWEQPAVALCLSCCAQRSGLRGHIWHPRVPTCGSCFDGGQAKLCQLLGILLHPSGVRPTSSKQSLSLCPLCGITRKYPHLIHCSLSANPRD